MRNPNVFNSVEQAFAHQSKIDELEQLIRSSPHEIRHTFFENNEGTLPGQIDKSIRRLRRLLRAAQK